MSLTKQTEPYPAFNYTSFKVKESKLAGIIIGIPLLAFDDRYTAVLSVFYN